MLEKLLLWPECDILRTIKRTSNFIVYSFYELLENFNLYCSYKRRRKIFPEADLGIVSTNSTPPAKYLWGATFSLTNSWTACSDKVFVLGTMYARGASPNFSCSTPITATSEISGWPRRMSSNSPGATCEIMILIFLL